MSRNTVFSLAVCLLVLSATPAFGALFSEIVDDSAATFSSFDSNLTVVNDPTAYGGSYHQIANWAGDGGDQSGKVVYQLSGLPAGNHLYNIYFSSPLNPTYGTPGSIAQWHIFNVAGDGSENFAQQIPWGGQFGTNKQWLGPNSGYNPGAFTELGPGPQNDTTWGDGKTVWMNTNLGQPYIYLTVQPFYSAPIAFDAILVQQVNLTPEPSSIVLGSLGAGVIGLLAWRRRRARQA